MSFRALLVSTRPYLALVWRYPLHLVTAFVSALVCHLMLTIQPLFVKSYINEAQRDVSKEHLLTLAIFMVGAALLAFIFDYISVAIRAAILLNLKKDIRQVHRDNCLHHGPNQYDFAVRVGLDYLAEIGLLVGPDFLLLMTSIVMIMAFLGMESLAMGAVTVVAFAAGIMFTTLVSNKLGKIGRYKETVKSRFLLVPRIENTVEKTLSLLKMFLRYDKNRFLLDTILVFISFTLFKLVPILIMVFYAVGFDISVGTMASIFLYYGMLHGPYNRLVTLMKNTVVNFSKTSNFREEIEQGLAAEKFSQDYPVGLVSLPLSFKGPFALSSVKKDGDFFPRVITDDMGKYDDISPQQQSEKETAIRLIKQKCCEGSYFIVSNDPWMNRHIHFYIDENMKTGTALARLEAMA